MPDPTLIIPIKLDPKGATAALHQLGAAGQAAGDKVAGGVDKATKSTRDFSAELVGIQKARMAFDAVVGVAAAIGTEMKRTADHTRAVAQDFIALRRTMQEVAALRGEPNTNRFTLDEARKAKAAGFTPAERRDLQAQFLNYAGAQVGEHPGAKLGTAQGEDFSSRIGQMMKESGLKPMLGAELGGSMLEQAKGPQDVDKLMKDFSETFQILQKGRVPLERAVGEISQIMSYGITPQEAAKMFAVVSPAASGEEGSSVRAALRAVQEMQNKGTGTEFGVTQSMTKYEAVQSFAKNIQGRKQAFMEGGDTETLAENKVQAMLAEKQIAADSREARGLVRGFGGQGVGLKAFERYEQVQKDTPADFEANLKAQYEASDQGKQAAREADAELVRAQSGEQDVKLEELRLEAKTKLEREGRFKLATPGSVAGDLGRSAAGKLTGNTVEETLINEEAIRIARERAGLRPGQSVPGATAGGLESSKVIDESLRKLIEFEEEKKRTRSAPPISAPPAPATGARMGG